MLSPTMTWAGLFFRCTKRGHFVCDSTCGIFGAELVACVFAVDFITVLIDLAAPNEWIFCIVTHSKNSWSIESKLREVCPAGKVSLVSL